jgi:uncharacterized protein YyaL (SSP411 family)
MNDPVEFTNRLDRETSPYLHQHAHNPVDWFPWGEEALARAKQLDRPIFLSIGYSACHWCHVMAHESFEDPAIGRLLNEHFVSIKVDREERPDLDQIYMAYVQSANQGRGGWPMSVFLTPELQPFFGGTYFPPDDRYGHQMPSFGRVLTSIIDWWQHRRDEVKNSARQIAVQLQEILRLDPQPGELSPTLLRQAAERLARAFDSRHGGFGHAPKFPHPMDLRLLLRTGQRFGDTTILPMIRLTLDKMAIGGIYDQLGGGFHRYSTDERWLVPHFEKMLYDNALLAVTYLEAFQATGDPFYRQVVEETLAYVQREMTSPEGPFYSTQDADSEGHEGKFFVWSQAEIEQLLGRDTAEVFNHVYGVTASGNWEKANILNRPKSDEECAALMQISVAELQTILAGARAKLFEERSKRIWPGRDEKVLTSWNGLMIAAFARAAQILDRPDYAKAAVRAADFLLQTLRMPDGRLFHTWSAGSPPKLNSYLEDYAYLLDALVSLYETTFEPRWIAEALDVSRVMIDQFWDESEDGFFYTGRAHETLIARTKDPHDNATPSGNSMAVTALLRLAKLTGREDLHEKAQATLRLFQGVMNAMPGAASQMLLAYDFSLGPVDEFAIVGDPSGEETRRVLRVVRSGFRPHQVVALKSDGENPAEVESLLPLLHGKTALGPVTTYVCRDFACQQPLIGAAAVEEACAVSRPS